MNRIKSGNILLYITYTVMLVAVLIKLDFVIAAAVDLFLLLVPLLLGAAIAFVLKKPYDAVFDILSKRLNVNKKGVLQLCSASVVYLMLIGTIAVIISFVVPQLMQSWEMLTNNLGNIIPALYDKLGDLGQLSFGGIAFQGVDLSLEKLRDVLARFLIGAMPQLYSVTNSIVKVAANIVMGLVFSVYILVGRESLAMQSKRLMKAFLSEKWYNRIIKLTAVSNDIFTGFVSGQITEAVILGALCFVGMVLLRLEYALLISVLVGVTSLIPIVGAFIGAIPSAFILFMLSPQKALVFVVFLIALQQFEGNVIYPKVVGGSIGLPPIWILLAITVGGGMFGVLGMMLSVPITSVIYNLVSDVVDRRLKES